MKLHLIDGTYELFRAYHALPPLTAPNGRPVGAVRGLLQSLLLLTRQPGVTHLACAFDHVIESFRNQLFAGYKTGAGVPEDLLAQFGLAERATAALGIVVWPMTEFEADDALATAAARWQAAPEVEQIVVCSPDKDLAQLVKGDRLVCLDRRRETTLNEAAVMEKFGVAPASIPDWLALVGDAADGIPGLPRWGQKTAAALLREHSHIEDIPLDPGRWAAPVRGAKALASVLQERMADALLYRRLATLRYDVPLPETLEQLEWRGVPRARFEPLCAELGFDTLLKSAIKWRVED